MYRIKTTEEFEKEFGTNWRSKIGWNSSEKRMDYLCGRTISRDEYNTAISKSLHIDSWMVTIPSNVVAVIKYIPDIPEDIPEKSTTNMILYCLVK